MWICISGDVIASHITLSVDSDLNGASPQFTLTCISIGGPATTVTWRYSDTVTEGTETVLDDRVTAQYTHTLTVTGRLGGLYTCTVANDKPFENSVNFTIKGNEKSIYNYVYIILQPSSSMVMIKKIMCSCGVHCCSCLSSH